MIIQCTAGALHWKCFHGLGDKQNVWQRLLPCDEAWSIHALMEIDLPGRVSALLTSVLPVVTPAPNPQKKHVHSCVLFLTSINSKTLRGATFIHHIVEYTEKEYLTSCHHTWDDCPTLAATASGLGWCKHEGQQGETVERPDCNWWRGLIRRDHLNNYTVRIGRVLQRPIHGYRFSFSTHSNYQEINEEDQLGKLKIEGGQKGQLKF